MDSTNFMVLMCVEHLRLPFQFSKGEKSKMAGLLQEFKIFCDETTIHGFRYLVDEGSCLAKKILWMIVIIASFSYAAMMLYSSFHCKILKVSRIFNVSVIITFLKKSGMKILQLQWWCLQHTLLKTWIFQL